MLDPTVMKAILALWRQCFGATEPPSIVAHPASGNNRVFTVSAGTDSAIAKWYYRGAGGGRDRLDSEWRFLCYAAESGITATPRPLACDRAVGLMLQECLKGVRPKEIGEREIDAAAEFFRVLNLDEHRGRAALLPEAQEACFSPSAHFRVVEERLGRLNFTPAGTLDCEAAELIGSMNAFWLGLRPRLERGFRQLGFDQDTVLPPERRCVSPADFGFHNAMKDPSAKLRFFDFEYAGWDDPAKTVDDFLLQPATPLTAALADRFITQLRGFCPDPDALMARAALTRPMFALKWCCIMLNPFAAQLGGPGRFADPSTSNEQRKRRQLDKALQAFQALRTHPYGAGFP